MSEITSVTVLTAADAANQLQSKGFDALGLTVPAFGTQWSTATTTADNATLRLSVTNPRAPFTGTFRLESSPVTLAAVDGTPITSAAGVLRLHPEAVHRLETLVRLRYGALQRPVPVAMAVHGVTVTGPQLMSWFRGGEDMGVTGAHDISFHDRRGLIIDPVAVASLLADLMLFRPPSSPPAQPDLPRRPAASRRSPICPGRPCASTSSARTAPPTARAARSPS